MKPSSSPSDPGSAVDDQHADGRRVVGDEVPVDVPSPVGLFDSLLAAGEVRAAVDDRAWLHAMLDAEAALARAQASCGSVPAAAAEAITATARDHRFDPAAIGAGATSAGNPVVPLVAALRAAVGPDTARYVHAGATSQDILDTAAMLVVRRALGPMLDDVRRAASAAARLAETHRDTLLPARTLLQQALPTTFGLVAAGWLTALDTAVRRLSTARDEVPAVQLGGAAGTLAAFGADGPALVDRLAAELDLAAPQLPWHTDRSRLADLAGVLGGTAGSISKIARDVTLHAQTEVAELAEERSGGSSTLPHKRNPVAAVTAVACAGQVPGLVATLLAAMAQEHQRAAGGWHAEWRALRNLLESVGSAAYWLRTCLEGLRVDAVRMRANLDLTGGALLAERVSGALAGQLGRHRANEIVKAAVTGGGPAAGLAERLAANPQVSTVLSRAQLDELLDPAGYLGAYGELIDRALRDHHSRPTQEDR
ncbi:3-carboxy-cis,cis-muconate cycloisomerase [Micromonospora sp. LOL_013]|uniref:3-carboxy-cis,cis-muconate cycloisomerase n=1 Tax=Micromonospora sp. LOL_013 TaxID=3345414 RepID=UPI003A84D595